MLLRKSLPLSVLSLCLLFASSEARARSFTVAVYNLENLFDLDGVTAYDQYQPRHYKPAHLRTKLTNACDVIVRLGKDGKGPDILMLQELELDQTPSRKDLRSQLKAVEGRTVAELLEGTPSPEAADLPAEAWLLKALEERGLTGYSAAVGADSATDKHEDGNSRAIKNVVFTRFPIKELRNHAILNARNILELVLDVDGHPLRIFSNHWKSGAGNIDTEPVRMANAKVLRDRLDEIMKADPQADILIGGDLNSQYNQKQRYPEMGSTAVNDVLRSQGDELALRTPKADLYNLWYELPEQARGSDTYEGEWGTLIQLIVSRGLYDFRGIQYVDGSFSIGKFAGVNETVDGTPMRWSSNGPAGSGFSDHFPIVARFVTVEDGDSGRWLALEKPSDGSTPSKAVKTASSRTARKLVDPRKEAVPAPEGAALRDGSFNGKIILVEALVVGGQRMSVEFRGENWEVYVPGQALREALRAAWKDGSTVRFYGELGQYRGRWQFVIRDASWLVK